MGVKKVVSPDDVQGLQLPGRELKWIVTPETVGAQQLSIAIMDFLLALLSDHSTAIRTLRVILILDGQVSWIDGEMVSFRKGDACSSRQFRHQVRNTGDNADHCFYFLCSYKS